MNVSSSMRAWLSWAITTTFVIFQFLLQTVSSVMAQHWKQDFNIDPVAVANLSAAFFYLYVFMQVPAGLAYDHFNPKLILTVAATTLGIGCILFAYTYNYYLAFFARTLMGMGASFGFVGMLQISSIWFSTEAFPMIVSLAETIAAISMTANIILLAWLVENFGWRQTMFYSGIVALIIAVLAFLIITNPSAEKPHRKLRNESIWKSLSLLIANRQIWVIGIYGFFVFSLINVFTSLWGVPFLMSVYRLTLSVSANIVSMVFLGIACGTISLSWISMQFGRRKPVLFFSSFIVFISLGILIFIPNLSVFQLHLILFVAGFFSAAYVLTFTMIKELMPLNYRATALAMTNMLVMISAPILQPLVGYFITHNFFGFSHAIVTTYRLSLAILPIGLLLATILVLFMEETYCKELDHESI